MKPILNVVLLYATAVIALPAQTFTTLFSFDGTDGQNPLAPLVGATDGSLYGTTINGGAYGYGTIFKITPGGTLTTLYSFCSQSGCADGAEPNAALVQATNGDFYGTTYYGGATDHGTVFKITPSGTLTTLYSFCSRGRCTDGAFPVAALVQAANGDLYGITFAGANHGGTIFKISPGGALTTLYRFCSQSGCADGGLPVAALVQAINGDLYGTTLGGGAAGYGTVFKITPSGTLTTLYSFCAQSGCTDGQSPEAGLVQAADGNMYGTTINGGSFSRGVVFKITPGGTFTTLYSFCAQRGCTDGANPEVVLVQATDGDLYGTTFYGGTNNYGTVFQITPNGSLTTLYSFCSQTGCTDGDYPAAGLVQDTNGDLYGTSGGAGAYSCPNVAAGCGAIFSLSLGLGPFVAIQPTSGKVGAAVKILGTNLTGATSVTFHGIAAVFTVVSNSLITTNVPAGATSGKVQVVAPSGTLSSNVPFRVRP